MAKKNDGYLGFVCTILHQFLKAPVGKESLVVVIESKNEVYLDFYEHLALSVMNMDTKMLAWLGNSNLSKPLVLYTRFGVVAAAK